MRDPRDIALELVKKKWTWTHSIVLLHVPLAAIDFLVDLIAEAIQKERDLHDDAGQPPES